MSYSKHPPRYFTSEGELENTVMLYPNYKLSNTFVISGPLGGRAGLEYKTPGRQFNTIKDAEKWVIETYGGYYERIKDGEPTRWAFRVEKGSHRDVRGGMAETLRRNDKEERRKFRVCL